MLTCSKFQNLDMAICHANKSDISHIHLKQQQNKNIETIFASQSRLAEEKKKQKIMAIPKLFALHANTINKLSLNNFRWRYAILFCFFYTLLQKFPVLSFQKKKHYLDVYLMSLMRILPKTKQQSISVLISNQNKKTTNLSAFQLKAQTI